MLSKEDFKNWSKDYVLFNHITTRIEGRKDDDLLGRKGGTGFPYFVFMNQDGNLLVKHKLSRSVDGFTKSAAKAKEVQAKIADLQKKADEGDKAAAKELFFLKADLSHYTAEQGRKAFDGLELTGDEKAKAETVLTGIEISEIMATLTKDKKTHIAAGKKFSVMEKAGKIPGNQRKLINFYYFIMVAAEDEKDAAAFEKILKTFKEKFGDNARYKRFIEGQEKKLDILKREEKK